MVFAPLKESPAAHRLMGDRSGLVSRQAISKPDKWALHELCDLPTHVKGPVCLFGDSAAATLPHQGQGAAQAIESAYVLSTLLGSPALNRSNAATALEVFNELR